jgi:hypothetical protein
MPDEPLIVCAGAQENPVFPMVMEQFCAESGATCRFVMGDWLSAMQFQGASLLWIFDDSAPWNQVHSALSHRLPLLVPESNTAMKALCITSSCGLYYDAAQAGYLLNVLLTDIGLRKRLGESGYAYLQRAGRRS